MNRQRPYRSPWIVKSCLLLCQCEHSDEFSRVCSTPLRLLGRFGGGFWFCLTGLTGPFAGIFTFREAVISIFSWLIDVDKYLRKRGDGGCPGCNTREESKRKGVTTKWECSRTNLTDFEFSQSPNPANPAIWKSDCWVWRAPVLKPELPNGPLVSSFPVETAAAGPFRKLFYKSRLIRSNRSDGMPWLISSHIWPN